MSPEDVEAAWAMGVILAGSILLLGHQQMRYRGYRQRRRPYGYDTPPDGLTYEQRFLQEKRKRATEEATNPVRSPLPTARVVKDRA